MQKIQQTVVVTIAALVVYAVVGTKTTLADWQLTDTGLSYQRGSVLSEASEKASDVQSVKNESEEVKTDQKEVRNRSVEGKRIEAKQQIEEQKQELEKKKEEHRRELEEKKKEQIMENKMKRLDYKAEIRFEAKEGKMRMETMNKEGKPEDLGEQDDFVIRKEEHDQEDLHIKKAKKMGEMRLERGKFAARTNFPLSIDPVTKELKVTTPNGTKVVTVLPDEAVKNMADRRVVDEVVQDESGVAVTDLTEVSGEPAYTIAGERKQRLLGVLSVRIPTTAVVSASDGRVMEMRQVFWSRVLDFVSF